LKKLFNPGGATCTAAFQTGLEARTASCKMGTRSLPRG